jgi:hypothetical protein
MRLERKRVKSLLSAVAMVALSAATARQIAAQVGQTNNPLKQPLSTASGETQIYFEFPIQKLKGAVPALKGIQYEDSQAQLPAILSGVAKKIADVLPRLPNLVSRESIYGFQAPSDAPTTSGPSGSEPWSREFKYLILSHHNANGSTTLEEVRTDSKGHTIDLLGQAAGPRGYGFAYQWLFFSNANQPEFRFRYLGEQEKGGRKTYVVAFAQDPRKVSQPAYFQVGGKTAPFYFQGVLWIDQASYDIVQIRTDLLAALPDLHLRQLTTELEFRSVPIHGYDAVFWLPSQVDISSDQGSGAIEENHRYSDYHLFHSESRIVATP